MKKVTVKHSKFRNMKLNVPKDGVIDIDEEGCADVSKPCAEILVKNMNDAWSYEDKDDDPDEEEVPVTDAEAEKFLGGLKYENLKKIAQDNKLDKKVEKKIFKALKSKDSMLAFIVKHMDEDFRKAITEIAK